MPPQNTVIARSVATKQSIRHKDVAETKVTFGTKVVHFLRRQEVGTDIKKSLEYCQSLVTDPTHTLFFLISDLDEYGSRDGLLKKIEELKDSGVTVVVLLAIEDGGRAYYDKATASAIAGMSVPCFACPPERLPELLAAALMKDDLTQFSKKE